MVLRQVARASALLPEAARARWIDAPEEERREWLQLQSYRASLAPADRPDFDALSRDEHSATSEYLHAHARAGLIDHIQTPVAAVEQVRE